jgi:hypothetical protein
MVIHRDSEHADTAVHVVAEGTGHRYGDRAGQMSGPWTAAERAMTVRRRLAARVSATPTAEGPEATRVRECCEGLSRALRRTPPNHMSDTRCFP